MSYVLDLVLTFSVFMTVHILFLWKFGPANFIRNAGLLLLLFLLFPHTGTGGKLILVSLWNMYIFALICSRNSVSLRILEEVRTAPGAALTSEQILARFTDRESLSARLGLMERNSFVRNTGPNEVELTAKGKWIARIMLFCRTLFGVPKSKG